MSLDLEEINLLSNADKNRYMVMERMFESDGWKFVVKWATANVEEAKGRVLNAGTWEQTCFARGALLAYSHFANLEKISEDETLLAVNEARSKLRGDDEVDNE